MSLAGKTCGKGGVRVLRLERGGGDRHEVCEKAISAALSPTRAVRPRSARTRSRTPSTSWRKNLAAGNEAFRAAVVDRLIEGYAPVGSATVTAFGAKWTRLAFRGRAHGHSFVQDTDGKPVAKAAAARRRAQHGKRRVALYLHEGHAVMRDTQSGWVSYIENPYSTLAETDDRIAAAAMEARWLWRAAPAD